MKMKKALYIVIPAVFVLIALAIRCGNGKKEYIPENVIPVTTVPVQRESLSIPVYSSGQLYPQAMVKLSFKVGGIIGKIHAAEGETVPKWKILATLDFSEIQASYTQASNGFEKAQRDLNRIRNLYEDHAATLAQFQDAQTAYNVAEATLKIARFNLDHATIKAPARGKILKRFTEEGEMIGVGMPMFLFGSTENQWVVKVGVSERDIVRLALQDKASLEFDAYPGASFNAYVSEIADAIDPASGTYEVELTLEKNEKDNFKLTAGFVAKVNIEPSAKETYFVIPVDSIVEGQGNNGVVFTVKNNHAVKVKIAVAHIFPGQVAVRSGLDGIDNVVTSGAAYLRDGSPVRVNVNVDVKVKR